MKVGIVGAGVIGNRLAGVFSRLESTEIAWVCDLDLGRAEQLVQRFGGKATSSYEDLLADNLDVIYIGVPPKFHAEYVVIALENDLNVICEKPISHTTAEGERMVVSAHSSKGVTAINLPFRYSLGFNKFKESVSQLDQIDEVSLRFNFQQWPRAWQNVEWLKYRDQGGPVREVVTHYIFALYELRGVLGEIRKIQSTTNFPDSTHCETDVEAQIEFSTGLVADLILTTYPDKAEENTLIVKGGEITYTFERWYKVVRHSGGKEEVISDEARSSETEMVSDFVRAIAGESHRLVSFQEALDVQRWIERLLNSS